MPQNTQTTELPTAALIAERAADHGDDSGRPYRTELAGRLNALVEAVRRVHKNPILRNTEKLLNIDAEVKAKAKLIAADFDGQRYIIERRQAEINDGIDAALRAPRTDWEPKAAELRSILRGMSYGERNAFLESVQGTQDGALLEYAVASVVPVMSGYSFETHKKMRDAMIARKNPDLLEHPKDLARRAVLLDQAEDGFRRTIAELVDSDQAEALRELIDPAS